MILKTVVLFLFGATIASAQFMPRLIRPTPYDMSLMPHLRSTGCPTGPAPAPVICQFMPNLSFNFKPQLIAPSTYIPPLVVEKCDEPQLEIHLPAMDNIVIPEAPVLPPITVPKLPVPIIPEPIPPMPIVEPCDPAPVAISSAVSIPTAPVLPPLQMPALPEIVEYHGADISETVVNEIDYQSMLVHAPAVVIPEVPVGPIIAAPCEDEPILMPLHPLPILPAPVLPPAPEIPIRVEIPARPIAPAMVIEEPCITDVVPAPMPIPIPPPALPMPIPSPALPLPLPIPSPALPMPIPLPEPAIVADPCEPAVAHVVMPYRPPMVTTYPAVPAPARGPVIFPARGTFVNRNVAYATVPYMRHF